MSAFDGEDSIICQNSGLFRSENSDNSLTSEEKSKPEDQIPDLPENKKARGSCTYIPTARLDTL